MPSASLNSMRAKKRYRKRKTPPPTLASPKAVRRRAPKSGQLASRNVARRVPTTLSIPSSIATAIGARLPITVSFFNRARRSNRAAGARIPTAAGFTPTLVGHGFRKNPSDGRRIITDGGHVCATSAGSGCRAMNGRRPGSHGARAMSTSAGRRSRPKRASIAAPAFTIGRTIIMTSGRINIPSSKQDSSARRELGAQLFQSSATSPSSIKRPTLPTSLTTTRPL